MLCLSRSLMYELIIPAGWDREDPKDQADNKGSTRLASIRTGTERIIAAVMSNPQETMILCVVMSVLL